MMHLNSSCACVFALVAVARTGMGFHQLSIRWLTWLLLLLLNLLIAMLVQSMECATAKSKAQMREEDKYDDEERELMAGALFPEQIQEHRESDSGTSSDDDLVCGTLLCRKHKGHSGKGEYTRLRHLDRSTLPVQKGH